LRDREIDKLNFLEELVPLNNRNFFDVHLHNNQENKVLNSYRLIQTLFHILVKRKAIHPQEINSYVSEMYAEYQKQKGERMNNESF